MREIKFERTVWAEKQLANLCPNHDIKRLGEILSDDDFIAQIDAIMDMIIIMNTAYERKAHFLDNTHEINVITKEELEIMTEQDLVELSNVAFADFLEDGKQAIEVEPKKEKAEQTKSI